MIRVILIKVAESERIIGQIEKEEETKIEYEFFRLHSFQK